MNLNFRRIGTIIFPRECIQVYRLQQLQKMNDYCLGSVWERTWTSFILFPSWINCFERKGEQKDGGVEKVNRKKEEGKRRREKDEQEDGGEKKTNRKKEEGKRQTGRRKREKRQIERMRSGKRRAGRRRREKDK